MGILDSINARLRNRRKPSMISDVTFRARRPEDVQEEQVPQPNYQAEGTPFGDIEFPSFDIGLGDREDQEEEEQTQEEMVEEETEQVQDEDVVGGNITEGEDWEFGTDLDLGIDLGVDIDIDNPLEGLELPEGFELIGGEVNFGDTSWDLNELVDDFGLDIENLGDFNFDQLTDLFSTNDWEFGIDEEVIPGIPEVSIPGLPDLVGDIDLGDFGLGGLGDIIEGVSDSVGIDTEDLVSGGRVIQGDTPTTGQTAIGDTGFIFDYSDELGGVLEESLTGTVLEGKIGGREIIELIDNPEGFAQQRLEQELLTKVGLEDTPIEVITMVKDLIEDGQISAEDLSSGTFDSTAPAPLVTAKNIVVALDKMFVGDREKKDAEENIKLVEEALTKDTNEFFAGNYEERLQARFGTGSDIPAIISGHIQSKNLNVDLFAEQVKGDIASREQGRFDRERYSMIGAGSEIGQTFYRRLYAVSPEFREKTNLNTSEARQAFNDTSFGKALKDYEDAYAKVHPSRYTPVEYRHVTTDEDRVNLEAAQKKFNGVVALSKAIQDSEEEIDRDMIQEYLDVFDFGSKNTRYRNLKEEVSEKFGIDNIFDTAGTEISNEYISEKFFG